MRILPKRRRLTIMDPKDVNQAKLMAAKEKLGREVRVFETSMASPIPTEVPDSEEMDDFYDFTPEDYSRLLATKKEDKFLKTRKIREAEEAARRSKITKATIRVRFPDNITLEATFHPSETIQSLIDVLNKTIAQPELPFYIYTTPPKRLIKDLSQDFYFAGFVPGAIVYFSYDIPRDSDAAVFRLYLREEIMSLRGLDFITEKPEPAQSLLEPVIAGPGPVVQERKPADKKSVKPKWLKM
ncbi:UBX domain [Dillenia turbinata]|uniref:UBX domain n=1 Tax=Dillenia turbinata TaxID=194707 RepID=A0AAN8V4X5_9MAGN